MVANDQTYSTLRTDTMIGEPLRLLIFHTFKAVVDWRELRKQQREQLRKQQRERAQQKERQRDADKP